MRSSASALPLLLIACATTSDLPAGPVTLDPIAFFEGETRGTGTLDPIVGRTVPVRVDSLGVREGNSLRLTQLIKEGDKPARTRVWTFRTLEGGGYLGTLTDAQGIVSMDLRGPRAFVGYTTPSGLRIHQQLALQADGRTILNRLEAYKFGIRLAVLDETIRKPLAK